MATIARLKELIGQTHQHGVKLEAEIKHLRSAKPRGWIPQVAAKRALLAGLKALNFKRRAELARLEHKPAPKPVPPKPQPKPPAQRFTMYDSTDVNTGLPVSHPEAVAGYVNGKWPSYNGLVKRYPGAKHLSIAVNTSADARCLDVETGDATPDQAPAWVRRQHARGVKRPVVYANTSTMPAVVAALEHDSIKRDEYLVWTAHYTGVPHIEPGSDATQYESVETAGHNYDASLCQPWFL
jgi:hypothetical protein